MTKTSDLIPGFKWPVAVVQQIDAPIEKVWDTISSPGNLENCHPFCKRNPVQAWPGAESRDEVHYLSGWIFERKFFNWIEGVGYDLEIGRRDGRQSTVSWRLVEPASLCTELRITVYPGFLQNIPVALLWLPHYLRLAPLLGSYLSSVVRGFEWYILEGEPVPRNQFGRHKWFSETQA